MKTCSKCKIEKELSGFCKDKKAKDGLNCHCNDCRKLYRIKVRESTKAYNLTYRRIHREELKTYSSKYNTDHKEDRKKWRTSSAGKLSQLKSEARYYNARRSRKYYGNNKNNITIPDNCQNCNSIEKVEAHHNDYNKPMDVIFLCQKCHKDWHYHNTQLNRVTGIFTEKK